MRQSGLLSEGRFLCLIGFTQGGIDPNQRHSFYLRVAIEHDVKILAAEEVHAAKQNFLLLRSKAWFFSDDWNSAPNSCRVIEHLAR